MVRWWWLSVLVAGLAVASPFELVPAGQSSYDQLAVLRHAGLLNRAGLGQTTAELTRFEFAELWIAAHDELVRRVADHPAPPTTAAPEVVRVTAAMAGLLALFEPELAARSIDLPAARELLRTLPQRLGTLTAPAAAPARPAPAERLETERPTRPNRALRDDPFALTAETLMVPGGEGQETGGRLPLFGSGLASGGVSVRQIALFEYDENGPSQFLKGHVLAADLRLRMGDNSVLLEYARSASTQFDSLFGEAAGEAIKATWVRDVSRQLNFDLGVHRLSSGFTPFSDVFGGGLAAGDMVGVRAGLALESGGFGLRSHATVYLPERERVGYANRFDTAMSYRVNDRFQLGVGFMTSTRRRLHNLEDAMLSQVNASVNYGISDRLQASMKLQLDSDQSPAGTTTGQYLGASLGLGF